MVLAARPVLSDLGAAVRRSTAQGVGSVTVLPAQAPLTASVVIPLSRVGARLAHNETSFYVGKVTVGMPPQELQVTFDTSSGSVFFPHRACQNITCLEHRRYSPWESATAMDVDADGDLVHGVRKGHRFARGRQLRDFVTVGFAQSDLGEGELKAVVVRDTVCVGTGLEGSRACVDMALLAATSMDEKPFRAMPSDGIIGLGLQSLSSGPLSSFLGRLFDGARNVVPQFGMAFGSESGELHIGGHDSAHLAAPLHWFPVDHPEQGFWQVAIQAVRVGNTTVDDCRRGCHGIVDTGVSRLGVQASRLPVIQHALASNMVVHPACHGPELVFDLGGMALTLQSGDYAGSDCSPRLGSLELEEPSFVGVYAFGETVLRRYYAAFDWEQHRLGFAPLIHDASTGARSHKLPDAMEGTLMI